MRVEPGPPCVREMPHDRQGLLKLGRFPPIGRHALERPQRLGMGVFFGLEPPAEAIATVARHHAASGFGTFDSELGILDWGTPATRADCTNESKIANPQAKSQDDWLGEKARSRRCFGRSCSSAAVWADCSWATSPEAAILTGCIARSRSSLRVALKKGGCRSGAIDSGLGIPLVAESHVAAFYPPNVVMYRALDVSTAYRLSMWLHYVVLAATTYFYATLGVQPWGSAMAAVAFALCGFQTVHSSHEPFYCLMPYLPLALAIAERYFGRGTPRLTSAPGALSGNSVDRGALSDSGVDRRTGDHDGRVANSRRSPANEPRRAGGAGHALGSGRRGGAACALVEAGRPRRPDPALAGRAALLSLSARSLV